MISISKAEHLVLKQRPGGTRKWPADMIMTTIMVMMVIVMMSMAMAV